MRDLTAEETAAMYHFHERYAALRIGAIEFWRSLTVRERRYIHEMVAAIRSAESRSETPR